MLLRDREMMRLHVNTSMHLRETLNLGVVFLSARLLCQGPHLEEHCVIQEVKASRILNMYQYFSKLVGSMCSLIL